MGDFCFAELKKKRILLTGAKHNTALARFFGGRAFALAFRFTALVARYGVLLFIFLRERLGTEANSL
jgi:hypothetical protein